MDTIEINPNLIGKVSFDRITFSVNSEEIEIPESAFETGEKGTKRLNIVELIENENSSEFYYKLHEKRTNFFVLEIVPSRIIHKEQHNIYAVNSEDVVLAINEVLKELQEKHNIILSIAALSLSSMEINKTVEISTDLKDFEDSLVYLFGGRVKTDKRENHNSFTITASYQKKSEKFYDKSAQIKNDLKVCTDLQLARFEVTYKYPNLIQNEFETLDIREITQEQIEYKFYKEIENLEKNLVDYMITDSIKLYKFFKKTNKTGFRELDTLYKEFNSKKLTVSGIAIPFYEVTKLAVKQLYKDFNVSSSNVSRDSKKIVGLNSEPVFNNFKNLSNLLQLFSKTEANCDKYKVLEKKLNQGFNYNFK